jgi:hypothetical protein
VREAFNRTREALRILAARPRTAWRFPDALIGSPLLDLEQTA